MESGKHPHAPQELSYQRDVSCRMGGNTRVVTKRCTDANLNRLSPTQLHAPTQGREGPECVPRDLWSCVHVRGPWIGELGGKTPNPKRLPRSTLHLAVYRFRKRVGTLPTQHPTVHGIRCSWRFLLLHVGASTPPLAPRCTLSFTVCSPLPYSPSPRTHRPALCASACHDNSLLKVDTTGSQRGPWAVLYAMVEWVGRCSARRCLFSWSPGLNCEGVGSRAWFYLCSSSEEVSCVCTTPSPVLRSSPQRAAA
jgi:hypothetical protein